VFSLLSILKNRAKIKKDSEKNFNEDGMTCNHSGLEDGERKSKRSYSEDDRFGNAEFFCSTFW
jgi:hypothetical protein